MVTIGVVWWGDSPSVPQLGVGESLFPPPVDGLAVAGAERWKIQYFWGEDTQMLLGCGKGCQSRLWSCPSLRWEGSR